MIQGQTKGISSIDPSFKKMILVASSEDETDVPSEPFKLCPDFFSHKSAVHAQIHLIQTLQADFKCAVTITVPVATALYHRNNLGTVSTHRPTSVASFLAN